MDDPLNHLSAYVRQRLGARVQYAQPWRVDELTRLAVRYWPHVSLEAIDREGGRNHRDVSRSMTLLRAQVREQWEALHGVGPSWQMILADTVEAISQVMLELWWSDPRWRTRLKLIRTLT